MNEALKLDLCVELDEALYSLLFATISEVALAIAALLFRMAHGHDGAPILGIGLTA
jgi:hypothetical protein